ncbi:hypothetical protein E0Z10_g10113 [Xylaria hypoxylon]|uniref:Uncharacterized protein n=1 Tax=Xylaria hypoxylon TaxID=37992 RepID=A0A4Z0Y4H0_9PEZI|nr:hypothetical protein E0Z10_g10113 [Xylaria hypoxylon]
MSPPLPLPSKAAIRALRSIALGTSCAIGVIVDDRRRRISTLKTAVSNKQKLKSSRHYHHVSLEQLSWPLDAAAVGGPNLQWLERDGNELRNHLHVEMTDPETEILEDIECQDPFQDESSSKYVQIPQSPLLQSSEPEPTTSQYPPFLATHRTRTPLASQSMNNSSVSGAIKYPQPSSSAVLQQYHNTLILSIENFLASTDENRLDRAVSLFMSNSSAIRSSPLLDRWLELSVRLSQECQASGRWEDASRILTTIIGFGPLNEAQYFAYNPLPIIEFHLRRPDSSTPCSTESITSAAKVFLAKLEEKHEARGVHMEDAGKLLVLETLALQRFTLALHVYWRMLGWAQNPECFVRWAIGTFFQHGDHKTVVKIFLLHYSRLGPSSEDFNKNMDYVLGSVEAMRGLNAKRDSRGLSSNEISGKGKASVTMDYEAVACPLGSSSRYIENKIEIAVKVDDQEMAHLYANKVIRDYPEMKDDIALKLAVLKAKAGDWDSVLATFKQVKPNELAEPTAYDDDFIFILGIFAQSHSAAETQDFAMLFVRDMGKGFHPYMVTLIAKKHGEARDMKGFMAWLVLCSREGFALDAGFCNSVLYNCWAKWKVSYPELRMIHEKFMALNPRCSDAVTHRIMSQAAHRVGNGYNKVRPGKTITVNKLAFLGRTTNKRDIFEAMNHELTNDRPAAAFSIYKRAISHGMPFCSHCHRLAVLAALRGTDLGSGSALSMIQDAHAQGHEVGHAVSIFIRHQIDAFHGNPEDVIMHMRNLISRFESSQIIIDTAVLTHMATVCVKINQHEKAIALCHLARDRSGSPHLCFSLQSFKALASAYSQLLDIEGMSSLIDHLSESEFSTDKELLLHLKSIRRLVKKIDPTDAKAALLQVIERGVQQLAQSRAEARTQGKQISQETLRIVGDALADLQMNERTETRLSKLSTVTDETKPVISTKSILRSVAIG